MSRPGALLDDAELGPAVLGPCGLVARGIDGHFLAEADGLDLIGLEPLGDQGLADGEGALLSETAVVLLGAALIGESGDNNGLTRPLQGRGNGLDFRLLIGSDGGTVVAKLDRRIEAALDV